MAKKKNKKNKKNKTNVIFALLCFILAGSIALFAGGYAYWRSLTQAPPEVEDTMVYDFDEEETVADSLQSDPVFEQMYEGNATELQSQIKDWVKNGGDIMYDDDVINVLCIGVDTRNKNTISGLTDSMIIVSINRELGQITFSSIMRDCYAYLESPEGNGSYNKINAAFPFYGIENLIDTIESHFKIRIDGYAMINFAFFKAVIDKLGGVDVNITEREANYLNAFYKWDLNTGDVILNGDEALAFCRSRKIYVDGDIQRTKNQREVLTAVLRRAASIKASEIPEYVETFMPYLETSYTESEVLSLGTKAVVGGWANFKVKDTVVPGENARTAHNGDVWYWEVDYPLAAKELQEFIYGESNITLKDDRDKSNNE